MIVTVTPNPSLDLTYVVDVLADTEIQRAPSATLEASGKGVNVSRVLHSAGLATVAVLPVAGAAGQQHLALLDEEGVAHRQVATRGSTRINTTVLHDAGRTLKVNAPGPALTQGDARELVAVVDAALGDAAPPDGGDEDGDSESWLVVGGSLPPGAPEDLVDRLVEAGHARGVRVAVDTAGPALARALAAGADLVSPNVTELAEIDADVAAAVRRGDRVAVAQAVVALATRVGTTVLLSAGAEGALWTDGSTSIRAVPPRVTPVNTAGAGDALLAGWLAGGRPQQRLVRGVAWGTATCLSATTVCRDIVTAAARHQPITDSLTTDPRATSART